MPQYIYVICQLKWYKIDINELFVDPDKIEVK